MNVGADVRERAARGLRLRFGHRVAVAGIAPGAQVPSAIQEERQPDRVAARFAMDLAQRRSGIGSC